jgi:Gpi18-like mannosyltransferase
MTGPAPADSQITRPGRLLRRRLRLPRVPWPEALAAMVGLGLALGLRYTLLDFKSVDYYSSLKPWYLTLRSQGFSAFATGFSNYNPPYLYLLYMVVRFLPRLPMVVAVKLPAIAADLVCAWLVLLLVRLKFPNRPSLPLLAAGAILFAPTVVLNSSFWGQADSLVALGLLGAIYFLARGRPVWAMIFYGVALAFKLQAVFLAPVIVALALRRLIPWKALLVIPLVLLLALVPALIAGRPIVDLLGIYASQTSQYEYISMNAYTAYTWLPGSKQVFNLFLGPATLMGGAVALGLCYLIYKSPLKLKPELLIELALLATLLVPFFLPKMHERYFYAADVLSIVFAFVNPALFWVPIIVVGSSFASYQPFLFERDLIPLPVLTLAILIVILYLARDVDELEAGPNPTPRAARRAGTLR